MNFKVYPTAEALGKALGTEFVDFVENHPQGTLGLATGSSPLETYRAIAEESKARGVSFRGIRTFNLDEYIACPIEKETYAAFMRDNLFRFLDIDLANTHFPNAELLDQYDEQIDDAGGVDFQLLGIGRNGHIGFNEPGTPIDSKTHVVDLTDSTREANARFFLNDKNLVPTQAITMGIGTIRKSRRIALIASTLDKAEAIAKLLEGKVDLSFPATVLIDHPDFTVYVTEEVMAAAKAR